MAPPIALPLPSASSLVTPIPGCTLPPNSYCAVHNPSPSLLLPSTPFHALIEEIKSILGPSSGLDSSDVDVNELMSVLRRYESSESDWLEFAFKDLSRNYTRNFVDHGNGKANVLLLVWSPGKGSLVHDHAGAHCLMKVLKGRLRETLYEMPEGPLQEGRKGEGNAGQPLKITRETEYGRDGVTYISDDIGLHKIENPDKDQVAVSLHIYTPPWAEKNGCYCFCEKTGKKTKVEMCNYYSVHGQIRKPVIKSC